LAQLTALFEPALQPRPFDGAAPMSWSPRVDDDQRMRAVKLIALQGQERRLDHQRSLLRRDLAFELQRCGTGQRTAETVALDQRIRQLNTDSQPQRSPTGTHRRRGGLS
jgi:hypothetical protein